VGKFNGGAKGVEVNAVLIAPNPITKDNLGDVIGAGWVTKEEACAGVAAGSVAACN
jgi:D-xylose transport system substrate-binding protein